MEVFNLNIIPGAVAPIIHASQYDEDREFRANLFEGDQVFELTGEETISVNVRKPDGNVVTAAVVNTGSNYVEFSTTEQMTACAGANLCQLRIENSPRKIGTLNFILSVERDPLEGGIQSESEINNLATQVAGMVAEEVATQYDSANVIFDNEPTENHGIGYTVTSEGIKTAIDNAFDYDNTASGSLVHITDGADNIPVKSLVSEIVAVQSGSGTPSPSNPRAISGFDSGIITRCGKNLVITANITDVVYNDLGQTRKGFIIRGGGTYTISVQRAYTSGTYIFVKALNADGTFGSVQYVIRDTTTANKTLTVENGGALLVYSTETASLFETIVNYCSLQIEVGDTATDFEAYNGNNYTFTFGQTIYGGYFDNKGNLVVTHDVVDLGSLTWGAVDSNGLHTSSVISDMITTGYSSDLSKFLCEIFTPKDQYVGWVGMTEGQFGINAGTLRIKWSSITSGTDFKTFVNGKYIVYKLANPITLAITSQDIPTLLGENNIFSNCGDVEVNYYTSKSNDILEFIDSEIGKKNGTNILIEENSQDSIKDYIDDEISSTKDYIDNGLNGKVDTSYLNDMLVVERKFRDVTFDSYYQSIEIDVTKSGYTPIGTVGFQTNTVGAVFFRCNLSGNTLYIGLVARDGTTPTTGTIATYVDVLYVKNS